MFRLACVHFFSFFLPLFCRTQPMNGAVRLLVMALAATAWLAAFGFADHIESEDRRRSRMEAEVDVDATTLTEEEIAEGFYLRTVCTQLSSPLTLPSSTDPID